MSNCSCTCNLSYATFRYYVFRRLLTSPPKSKGQPVSRRRLHASTNRYEDGKGTRYANRGSRRLVDLEDENNLVHVGPLWETAIDEANTSQDGNTRQKDKEWGKHREKRREKANLTSLAAELKKMATDMKRQLQPEAEDQPSQSSLEPSLRRARSSSTSDDELPQSPLEKKMKAYWALQKKRQSSWAELENMNTNPWAAMLAGQMRMDTGSRSRLPKPLLLDMSLVENPDDGKSYLLPEVLADLDAFQHRVRHYHRKGATNRGRVKTGGDLGGQPIHIIPYQTMFETLSDQLTVWDSSTSSYRSRKGAVSKTLFGPRFNATNQKIVAFQKASKEYWSVKEQLGELDDDMFKKPEPPSDFVQAQWQPELPERMTDIMRQRVLLTLDVAGEKQNEPGTQSPATISFDWPDEPSLDLPSLTRTSAHTENHDASQEHTSLNDMSDIEGADAIEGGGRSQGDSHDPRPPIAGESTETTETPPKDPMNKADHRVWLPGSFILHIGPSADTLRTLPYLDPSAFSGAHPIDITTIDSSQSKYIPPFFTVHASDTESYRIPVFNLPALLDWSLSKPLYRILSKYQSSTNPLTPSSINTSPIPELRGSDHGVLPNINFCIFVKNSHPTAHFIAQELWQLWRYVGGRDALVKSAFRANGVRFVPPTSSTTTETSDQDSSTTAQSDSSGATLTMKRQGKKPRLGYKGMTATAMDYLDQLLGFQEPSEARLRKMKSFGKGQERHSTSEGAVEGVRG